MRNSNIVLFLLLLPMTFATSFYLDNSTTQETYGIFTSSYNFQNAFVNVSNAVNDSIQHATIQHRDLTSTHYTISGTGTVNDVSDPRCEYTQCLLFQGVPLGGPTLELGIAEHSVFNTSGLQNGEFRFAFTDLDLEIGEYFDLYFWNGISYDKVFSWEGENNALTNATWTNQNQTVSIQFNGTYSLDTFSWFFESGMNSDIGDDAVIVHFTEIRENGTVVYPYPSFYHEVVGIQELIDALNVSLYMNVTTVTNITTDIDHYRNTTLLNTYTKTFSLDPVTSFFTHDVLENQTVLGNTNDVFVLDVSFSTKTDQNVTLSYASVLSPSLVDINIIAGSLNVTNIQVNNVSFPYALNFTVEKTNPIDTTIVYRDGKVLGNAFLCSPTTYCFSDATVEEVSNPVTYSVYARDVIGFFDNQSIQVHLPEKKALIITPQYDGIFYVPVNQTHTFSTLVTDTRGDILEDATLTLNFTATGDEFTMVYNPTTQFHEVAITFLVEGDYPFILEPGPSYYAFTPTQITEGLVRVRTQFTTCFELYADRNLSSPHVNNLAQVWAYDTEDIHAFVRGLSILNMWTETTGTYDINMFHAPYVNGKACLDLYNATASYTYLFIDGAFRFPDNYNSPEVLEYFGTSIELGSFSPEPSTTYKFYSNRKELHYGKLFGNFETVFWISLIIGISVAGAMITENALVGFVLFLFSFVGWAFLEMILRIFG